MRLAFGAGGIGFEPLVGVLNTSVAGRCPWPLRFTTQAWATWPLLAALLGALFLIHATGSRAASPRPVVLVGASGTPGGGQSIDLSGSYATAAADISALPDDGSSVEVVLSGLDFVSITLTNAVITADGTNYTVVIRGKATGLFELQEQLDLMLLATWGSGGAGPATISLGGYVPHNFDLSLLNDKFQYPAAQPEFQEVWFTQSTGPQPDPSAASGAAGFYPAGHQIPAGVAFRGEFDPASLIGDYAAGLLGYGSGRTVALIGVFAPGTTIYNDKLTLQTNATLEGHMDLSGLGPLFNTVTLGDDLTIGLQLDTQAPNSQTGGVFNYGIKAYMSGSMAVSQDLLGKPLNLSLSALFEYSTQSQAAFVTFQATAAGAWTDLQSLDGFSAQSVDILLRFSTEPSAQSAKLVVSGHFSNTYVSGPTFDVSFDITAKNQDISIAASIGVSGQVSVQDLIDAFQGIVAPDLPPTETWSALDSIALDGLSVQVRVGTDGVKLYAEAGATVLGLETSVALYVGPDATQQGKYGVLLAARRQGSLDLGDLVPGLPPDIPAVTLPDTIFYFSSLRFDADRLHYPTPALFDFFNAVWGTGGEVNEKITIEAGAGLVSSIHTGSIVPAEVSDFLRDALWVDVNKPVVIAGNVPLFGKTKLGLTVYLPESRPDPAGDAAPEFFEYGSFFLHMEADQQQLLLSVSGNLGIRLRKPGVPAPTSGPYVESNYDHLVLSAAASLEVNLGPPPTVQVTLQGAVTAPDGFQPFGLDWLEFNNLTLQISLATTPGGNVAIKLGIRTSVAIGQPPDQLDIDASLLMSVQTLQVFPWATVKLNGVRLQSNRGLETVDLLALADLFTGQSLNITVPDTFPNIAIRNFEISYSDENNPALCLTRGFRIKGDLYIDPASAQHEPGPECSQGQAPQPGESCAGDTQAAQDKRDAGCVAGILLEVIAPGGQDPAGVAGSFAIAAFDIGTAIHFGPAELELILNRTAASLTMRGQLTIDGVGSGQAELNFTAAGLELLADAKLFNAFWAHVEVLAAFDLQSPTLQAHGYLRTEFGSQISQALQQETANLRALLAALDGLVDEFENPRNGLDDLASAIMTLPATLQGYGATPGPALTSVSAFVTEVDKAVKDAQNRGVFPSLDEMVNNILQGKTITVTEGVHGTYVPSSTTCVGWLTRWGTCIGVWVYPTCTGVVIGGTCWLIPPVTLDLPGLCTLGLVNFVPCNAYGLKLKAADAIKDAFQTLTGLTYKDVRAALDQALASSGNLPALFDVTCAAFDIDLGAGPSYSNTLQLGIAVTLLGRDVSTGNLVWDFNDGVLANTTGLVRTLVFNMLQGNTGPPITGCDTQTPPPPIDKGLPKNLAVTLTPDPVAEGSGLNLTASFDEPGVDPGDTRTYRIDWGDGAVDTQTLQTGVTTFQASHIYADDPAGPNDTRSVAVTVTNSRSGSTSATRQVTVTNAAPTAGPMSVTPAQINEGDQVTVSGSFSDPGTADTHTVLVQWNDGSPPSAATVNQQANTFTATHTYADDDPTNTAQDTVQIVASITDDDGGTATASTSLTVANVAPTATVSADAGAYHEGDTITISGTLSDAGISDLHRIELDWRGAGVDVVQQFALPFGQTAFSAQMPAIDDNPTGTPSDQVTLIVRVIDDDTGASEYVLPITVINDPPAAVTVQLDPPVIDENGEVTAIIHWTDPGIADGHTVLIDWGDGSNPAEIDLEDGERETEAAHQYLDDNPSGTASDTYVVSATVTDDDTGSGSGSSPVVVHDVAPVLDAPAPAAVQYSDPLAAPMVLRAFDVSGYATNPETLAASTRWSVDGSPFEPGLPPNLSLTSLGCAPGGESGSTPPRQTCTWAIGNGAGETLDVGPGSYTFEFTVVDDDGRSSVATSTLTVLPEDARAYYIGPDFAAAAPEDGLLAFELRAIVRDISAEPPAIPEWDPDPGDVTHAFVTFVDRGTGAVLCSAPVQLVFPGLRTLGDAWCTWYVDPAALPDGFESFRIGIVVGGWYHRDDPADDATVLVSGPMKGSLDGGGWVRLANAAGAFAPDPDTKVKIELEAKFRHLQKDEDGDEEDERKKDHEKKHRPELEGKVKIRFTSHGVEYEIETTSLSSLGLACPDPALGPAVGQLEAVAVLKTKGRKHDDHDDHDGHDNDGGIVAAGLRLQIRAGDAEHHHSDTVGFTLWSPTGELLLSSDWTGVGTAETLLGGGGFEVHLPKGEPKKCGPDDHDEHDEHDSSDGHKEAVRPKD